MGGDGVRVRVGLKLGLKLGIRATENAPWLDKSTDHERILWEAAAVPSLGSARLGGCSGGSGGVVD